MALNFQEYVDAVKALASNTIASATMSSDASEVLKRYSHYLENKTKEATGDALSFDKWSAIEKNIESIPALVSKDEKAKKDAIKTAQDYLNNNEPIKKAQDELFENGKYVMKKAGSFFEMVSDFLKQNPITLAALGLGAVAGNALGFGIIGTLLFAAAAAVAGGALGDTEKGGFIPKLLGLKPHEKATKTDPNIVQQTAISEAITLDINDAVLDLTGMENKAVSVEIKDKNLSVMKLEGKVLRENEDVFLVLNNIQKADHCGGLCSPLTLTNPLKISLKENGIIDPRSIVETVEDANRQELVALAEKNKDLPIDGKIAYNPSLKPAGVGLPPR